MTHFEDFSMEQSEELIAQLKTNSLSGFTQLHTSLKLLSHVSELSPVAMPPVLPSAVDQPIESITLRRPRAHRSAITSLLVTAVLASASFAAAGVTGRGPAVIVEAAQKSGEIVAKVVGTVGNTLTGNNDQSSSSGTENGNSAPGKPVTSTATDSSKNAESQQDSPSGSTSDGDGQSTTQVSSEDGQQDHPIVTPDPSPTHSQNSSHTTLPNIGTGLGGLVLPSASNSQSGVDSHESDNGSD